MGKLIIWYCKFRKLNYIVKIKKINRIIKGESMLLFRIENNIEPLTKVSNLLIKKLL